MRGSDPPPCTQLERAPLLLFAILGRSPSNLTCESLSWSLTLTDPTIPLQHASRASLRRPPPRAYELPSRDGSQHRTSHPARRLTVPLRRYCRRSGQRSSEKDPRRPFFSVSLPFRPQRYGSRLTKLAPSNMGTEATRRKFYDLKYPGHGERMWL